MDRINLMKRRSDLADWLYRERRGGPYTVGQIVDVSGIYDGQQDRDGKCRCDLRSLQKNAVVRESAHRPAQWESENA
jgi:hypothetical protein